MSEYRYVRVFIQSRDYMKPDQRYTARFHQWVGLDHENIHAIVELADGTVEVVGANCITFADKGRG